MPYGNNEEFNEWAKDHDIIIRLKARQDYPQILGEDEDSLAQTYRLVALHAWLTGDPSRGTPFTVYLMPCLLNAKRELIRSHGRISWLEKWNTASLDADVEEGGVPEEAVKESENLAPQRILERKEVMEIIRTEMDRLSERDRDIVLSVAIGYTQAFVAEKYGMKQPSVSGLMKRFRRSLKRALEKSGYSPQGQS